MNSHMEESGFENPLRTIIRNSERVRLSSLREGDIITVYENADNHTWNIDGRTYEVVGDPSISYPDGLWGVEVKPVETECQM